MQFSQMSMEDLMPLLREQLNGGTARLGITGTSMRPMLRNGKDSVLLRSAQAPKKGDILLYHRQNGRYVLHRIVSIEENTYLCCGDNQWRKEKVTPEQIDALVCGYYRDEKKRNLDSFCYRFYVNLLPLRRLYCRLRDFLFSD